MGLNQSNCAVAVQGLPDEPQSWPTDKWTTLYL